MFIDNVKTGVISTADERIVTKLVHMDHYTSTYKLSSKLDGESIFLRILQYERIHARELQDIDVRC